MPVLSLTANTVRGNAHVHRNVVVQVHYHMQRHTRPLHTNTHNCMHMLVHTSLCSCDCTGATSAHTSMDTQTQHLHPAHTWPCSALHMQPAPQGAHGHPHRAHGHPHRAHKHPHVQPAQATAGVSRAPAGTHTTHTLSTSPHARCSLFCSLE